MTTTQTYLDRYRQLPRAARWAVLAAIGIGLFSFYDYLVQPLTESWDAQANGLLAKVEEALRSEARADKVRKQKEGIQAIGAVELPTGEAEGSNPLNDAVNATLKRHTVSKDSFNQRSPSKLTRGTLAQTVGPNREVQRITGDLRFDASPDEATAIIAELEASPEIEAISSVRITRQGGPRKVTVDMTLEAWLVSRTTK